MSRRWVLVDDQKKEGCTYSKLLTTPDELEVIWVAPEENPGFLRKVIEDKKPTGVLLDHALNEADSAIAYAGSTLAGFLRTEFPDMPLVVLSAKLQIDSERKRFDRTKELFDWELDKHDVTINTESAHKALVILTDGYERLKDSLTGTQNPRDGVAVVLDLPRDLDPSSDRAEVFGLAADLGSGDAFKTARFIIHSLLRFPGPMLSLKRAVVAMGVAPDVANELAPQLDEARYAGVFAGIYGHDCHWREMLGNIDLSGFSKNPARCVVCGEQAHEICEVCLKPVDGLHSLPVHRREAAPEMFLRGRVCGFCLGGIEERHRKNLTVDGAYVGMIEGIVRESEEITAGRMA